MEKIAKYTTAQDTDSRALDKRVNTLIEMGYQPWGAPYSAYNGRAVNLCQALVKFEGDDLSGPSAEDDHHSEPAKPEVTRSVSAGPKLGEATAAQPALRPGTAKLKFTPKPEPTPPPPPPAPPVAPPPVPPTDTSEPPTVYVEPLD